MHYPLNYYSKPEIVNNRDCMLMQHRRFAFYAVIQLRLLQASPWTHMTIIIPPRVCATMHHHIVPVFFARNPKNNPKSNEPNMRPMTFEFGESDPGAQCQSTNQKAGQMILPKILFGNRLKHTPPENFLEEPVPESS